MKASSILPYRTEELFLKIPDAVVLPEDDHELKDLDEENKDLLHTEEVSLSINVV